HRRQHGHRQLLHRPRPLQRDGRRRQRGVAARGQQAALLCPRGRQDVRAQLAVPPAQDARGPAQAPLRRHHRAPHQPGLPRLEGLDRGRRAPVGCRTEEVSGCGEGGVVVV
ncbi:hypothetical protein SLS54_008924, partial [Diplodia seriata]